MTQPTKSDRLYWQQLRELGCILCCSAAPIQNGGTGKGLQFWYTPHQGAQGLHMLSANRSHFTISTTSLYNK